MVSLPFLVPVHTAPIPSFYAEWLAAALGLAATVALLSARALPLPGATLLALAIAAIAAIQAMMGRAPVPQLTEMFGLYLLWSALLASAASHIAQEFGRARFVKALATAILIGSIGAALTAIFQPFLTQAIGWAGFGPATGGALGQRNHFTDYLWLGLASAVYLRSIGALPRGAFWSAAALLTLTATLAGQRSSFLYAAALIVISFWQARSWRHEAAAEARYLSLGIAALFALTQLISMLLPTLVAYERTPPAAMRAISELRSPSIRMDLDNLAAHGIATEPLLGNGIGSFPSFALAFADDIPPANNPGPAEHGHNMFLDLGAELGLPVALLVIAAGFAWILRLRNRADAPEAAWGSAVLAVLALHSMIEYPLWHTYFLGLLAVVAGAFGKTRAVGQRLAPAALTLGLLAWGSASLISLARDNKSLETALALGREPATMPAARAALLRVPPGSLLSPWVSTTACVSLDPLEVPLNDGLAVCNVAMSFAPTVESGLNKCILLWRDGKSNVAAETLRRLTLASSSYDSQKLDALIATVVEREPAFAAVRQIGSSK